MKRINAIWLVMLCIAVVGFFAPSAVSAADHYILGLPTSLGFPDGDQAHKAVTMAVEEAQNGAVAPVDDADRGRVEKKPVRGR